MAALERYKDTCDQLWKRGTNAQVGMLLLTALCAYLAYANHRLMGIWQRWDGPVFFKIDELGKARPIGYKAMEFTPGDSRFEIAIKSSLVQFCELYFRKRRDTIQYDAPQALLFLSEKLSKPLQAAYNAGELARFKTDLGSPEVGVQRSNISLETVSDCGQINQNPCSADVSFFEVSASKRTPVVAHLTWVWEDVHGHPETYLDNPFGIVITDIRVERGLEATN